MSAAVKLRIPTPEEEAEWEQEFIAQQRCMITERRASCLVAIPALTSLAEVLKGRSGQPYKVRTILYSLWNGKPCCINELLGLDWEIRKDLCAVLLAFGYEDNQIKFFYDAVTKAVKDAGQWEWFLEEFNNIEDLESHVKAAKERSA